MNIQNGKSLVRHEIMNSLMVLLYTSEKSRFSQKDHKELKKHITILSKLLIHEQLLIGEKYEPFKQHFFLQKSYEYISARLQSENERIIPLYQGEKIKLHTDQQQFNESLYKIFYECVSECGIDSISFPKNNKKLTLHKKKQKKCLPQKIRLEQLLKLSEKDISAFDLHISLLIAENLGIKIQETEQSIIIRLP